MPYFINTNHYFIHIPKTGGSSLEKCMTDHGHKMLLFNDKDQVRVNGHSPQHMTYREIRNAGFGSDVQYFTILRNPVDRVYSEFHYLKKYKQEEFKFRGFDDFLDLFLDETNEDLFDNHNVSSYNFLVDTNNKIPEEIKIFDFFDAAGLEKFLSVKGLSGYRVFQTAKPRPDLNQQQLSRIREYFADDFNNFRF